MVYPDLKPPNNYIICGNILFYDIHGDERKVCLLRRDCLFNEVAFNLL